MRDRPFLFPIKTTSQAASPVGLEAFLVLLTPLSRLYVQRKHCLLRCHRLDSFLKIQLFRLGGDKLLPQSEEITKKKCPLLIQITVFFSNAIDNIDDLTIFVCKLISC